MINNVTGGPGVIVSGGSTSFPYIDCTNTQNTFKGLMRMNQNNLEIFDGNAWTRVYMNSTLVSLDAWSMETINWARGKMQEEADLKARMEKHPGLKDAYEKFKVMDVLTQEKNDI